MGIGVGIFLVAVGAILAFAVEASVSGLDLAVVGWVMIAAGALGILLEIALFAPRRRVGPAYAESVPAPVVVRRDVY